MKSGFRRIGAKLYALALVLSLVIVAWVLYGTGAYDSWRDSRSLDQACDGTLAQGGLSEALRSSNLSAGSEGDSDYLTACNVHNSETGPQASAVDLKLRWSTASAPSGELVWYDSAYNGVRAQAAPLGNGWSGVVRQDGIGQVMVMLDCVNQKNKALVAYGDLSGPENSTTMTGLGRVTSETAQKAAEKYGCQAKPGKQLTYVSTAELGKPGTAKPLAQAQGSCAALRGTKAAQSGTPQIMEYPADADAPQTNCYLVTKDKKPGYGLYAYYGAAAKDFQSVGFPSDKDWAWATAKCPQSSQEATFMIYRLYDTDTDTNPVAHYSAKFAKSALKAFADNEAQLRGCSDVHVSSVP